MLSNPEIPIYLVSLKADKSRRAKLKEKFIKYYDNFIHIEAIDGRELAAKEYFEKTRDYYAKYKKIMSPPELGCTLSHIKALETFLETGNEYALILEDDVIANDESISEVFEISKKLNSDSLLLCGGQINIPSSKYRFGKKTELKKTYEVIKFSYPFVFGACCYVVTRKSAQQILSYHSNCLTLADRWGEFFINSEIKIYYTNLISHPEDLKNSHLESDRLYFNNKKEKESVFSKDIIFKIFRKIYIYYIKAIIFINKYERLPY